MMVIMWRDGQFKDAVACPLDGIACKGNKQLVVQSLESRTRRPNYRGCWRKALEAEAGVQSRASLDEPSGLRLSNTKDDKIPNPL